MERLNAKRTIFKTLLFNQSHRFDYIKTTRDSNILIKFILSKKNKCRTIIVQKLKIKNRNSRYISQLRFYVAERQGLTSLIPNGQSSTNIKT